MKTEREILDELAKESHYEDWSSMRLTPPDDSMIENAMRRYALEHFEDFYFEMGEDYNLWDEEIEPYPVDRILTAMKAKWQILKNMTI